METKNKRTTAVSDALSLIFGPGYFGRSEYSIPREMQLSIEEPAAAFGNADGFCSNTIVSDETCTDDSAYCTRLSVLPCFKGMEETSVCSLLRERRFHIPCGKTDITLAALESVYELRQKYGIRKFLLLTADASEREQLNRTISVMQDYFSDKYYGLKLTITTYESDNLSNLRSFALSDDIQLMIINKECFIRKNNLMKRPSSRLDGLTPAELLRPARCVAITVSENMHAVRAVLKHNSVFDPLCTICFTRSGEPLKNIPTVVVQKGKTTTENETKNTDSGESDTFQFHI